HRHIHIFFSFSFFSLSELSLLRCTHNPASLLPSIEASFEISIEAFFELSGFCGSFPPLKQLRRGLISDYRHAVEITAESEGFGSSGRVDTEMTLSEDSCSPKRKRISLNGDSHDQFGVPLQVLSFSKMSRSERKELEVRLRRELEEVRILQRRVASFSTSAVLLSPASDIRSCSDGQKRPPLENVPSRPEHPVQGKKQPVGRNGARMKKGFPGQIGPPKQVMSMNTSNSMLIKRCENLLSWLMEHQFGWVFNEPVDVVKLNIPDYYTVIKHPMDFSTIKSKLARGEYTNPLAFAADVRLTFSNAMTYNPPGNDVHFMAQSLSKNFEQRWKVIEKKIPPSNADAQVLPLRVDAPLRSEPNPHHIPPSKKKKVAPVEYTGKSVPVKKVMADDEKHKLSTELEALIAELPDIIIDFLKENSSGGGEAGEDEIEIDIDALSDDVLFKLRKLLDDYLLEKKKNEIRAEPCEMELHNESGFSNSSIQAGKGNDAIDEDVDIGGSDHPISSFPPVDIDKDTANTANKNNRYNSPSSSSSDSGSSSSEKARLQAEAKAAEEARKKAEAEAAAEAKRKRELEREAARLALQQMEKTVDINENCQFMEDLEMLSSAPADDLSSFMGDASPNDSQNGGLGSFRFRGNSNPLEQLGLYRKDDDEEEEEVEAPQAPDTAANDVEEGEID
ncbi:Transcription factor GTE10, partial [Bienertia sinuspersici]